MKPFPKKSLLLMRKVRNYAPAMGALQVRGERMPLKKPEIYIKMVTR
jgi:hypothetical protein